MGVIVVVIFYWVLLLKLFLMLDFYFIDDKYKFVLLLTLSDMNNTSIFSLAALGFASLLTANASTVISINFANKFQAFDANEENTAGVVTVGYWNTFDPLTPTNKHANSDPDALFDNSGNVTNVSITSTRGGNDLTINNVPPYGRPPIGFAGTHGNSVMNSYVDTSSQITFTISDLNGAVGPLYDVYLYSMRVLGNTSPAELIIGDDSKFIRNLSHEGPHTEVNYTDLESAFYSSNTGDYVVFRNIDLDTLEFTLKFHGHVAGTNLNRAALSGIQIVAVPEPSSAALVLSLGCLGILRRRRA